MTETQLDRIENMLKALISSCTAIELKGTNAEKVERLNRIKNYSDKPEGVK